LYFTPYDGNQVALFNGQWWSNYAFSEIPLSLPATTNTTYDVFLYDNAGTLTPDTASWTAPDNGTVSSISSANPPVVTVTSHTLSTDQLVTIAGNAGAANNGTWRVGTTTSTTFTLKNLDGTSQAGTVGNGGTWQRADQTTARATSLVLQDGIWVMSGSTNKRYLGTIRTTGVAGQCEDSEQKRFVWNNKNRVSRKLLCTDSTASWTYAVSAYRAARNDLSNRVEMVIGLSEDIVKSSLNVFTAALGSDAAATVYGHVGLGVDSITTNSADTFTNVLNVNIQYIYGTLLVNYSDYLGVGYHYLSWLEYRDAGTVTYYGYTAGVRTSGLIGEVRA
jgi:hypothetical protein